ncbi:hypothetical protein [Azorhizobium doebereinerae]|uniref:hypothetical protein n=1 Tax=Azorhizobium doebereinerae TaxID=281091 RepID=UPI0012EBF23D|nr:hypothetical protein [Azorhizobium doebereinerae]
MPSLKDFIEAMGASWPVALAIVLGALGILAGDHYEIRYLQGLPSWALGTVFFVGAFALAVLTVGITRAAIRALLWPFRAISRWRYRRKKLAELYELPPEETHVLAWAVQQRSQVILAPLGDRRITPLVAKGFLHLVPGRYSVLDCPYKIPDFIWETIKNDRPADGSVPNPFSPFSRDFF